MSEAKLEQKDSATDVLSGFAKIAKSVEVQELFSEAEVLKLVFAAWRLTAGIEPQPRRKSDTNQILISNAASWWNEFASSLHRHIKPYRLDDGVPVQLRKAIQSKLIEIAILIDAENGL